MQSIERKPIDISVQVLKEHLETVGRVSEWAKVMGYDSTQNFSYDFVKHFKVRPEKVLKQVHIISIVKQIHTNKKSNLEIALAHSLPHEKALYNFVKYHLTTSPTQIKEMSKKEIQEIIEKFSNKIKWKFK